jgi:hypothetical protein
MDLNWDVVIRESMGYMFSVIRNRYSYIKTYYINELINESVLQFYKYYKNKFNPNREWKNEPTLSDEERLFKRAWWFFTCIFVQRLGYVYKVVFNIEKKGYVKAMDDYNEKIFIQVVYDTDRGDLDPIDRLDLDDKLPAKFLDITNLGEGNIIFEEFKKFMKNQIEEDSVMNSMMGYMEDMKPIPTLHKKRLQFYFKEFCEWNGYGELLCEIEGRHC